VAMELSSGIVDTNRPYCPPSNVAAVLQRLRSRNLPERVGVEYLRDAGVSEGTIGRTMFGLRFIGLVEGETPTPALRSISTSTDEEYQGILAGLLREAYREVFEVLDPAEDQQTKFQNFFRRYTPASQRVRMVIFFLGMCREAGIPVFDAPRARTSGAAVSGGVRKRSTGRSTRTTAARPKGQSRHPGGAKNPALIGADGGGLPGIGTVTGADLALLDESEFDEVWVALGKVVGKVARARARAQIVASTDHPAGEQEAAADA
jgi:hypothetical protein